MPYTHGQTTLHTHGPRLAPPRSRTSSVIFYADVQDASIDFTLQALEYAGADEDARAQVMGLFIPDVADSANAQQPYVRAALDYAAQVRHTPTLASDAS